MGKGLNALLGRSSKASKLKMVTSLAVSRIAILKNLHAVRCSQATSDVVQLLQQDQQRALLRVEQVIKEQNALDALVMIEKWCHLLGERSEMVTNSWECPDEVKEAISSLIFAASRTGDFPELQEIRRVLTNKYGKEFVYSAVELRHGCRVHPKMVERLSTERRSLETRQNLLKQIAKENRIEVEFIGESRNTNLQQQSEKLNDVPVKDDCRDGAAAAEDAFESTVQVSGDDHSESRRGEEVGSGSDDEDITETPNRYDAKMSRRRIFRRQGKTTEEDTRDM